MALILTAHQAWAVQYAGDVVGTDCILAGDVDIVGEGAFQAWADGKLRELREQIQDTQAAFEGLEENEQKMAFGIFNGDWSVFEEDDVYGVIEKEKKGRMSLGPNWILPVVDQILVSLLGHGLGLSVVPKPPAYKEMTPGLTAALEDQLQPNGWRALLNTALTHMALARRAVFRLGWWRGGPSCNPMTSPWRDGRTSGGTVEVVRPNRFWFDLEALFAKKCSFMVEMRLYSQREFRRRFSRADCFLDQNEINAVKATTVPEQYSSHAFLQGGERKNEKWVMVYEHYDFSLGMISYILADTTGAPHKILTMQPMVFCPYVIATFGHNGVDARGTSESLNILRQQRNLDTLSDRVTAAMNRTPAGFVVDGRIVNKTEQVKLASFPDLALVSIEINREGNLRDALIPFPEFTVPSALWTMRAEIEADIAKSTAFAEIQQGRASGFRSATEASIADANLKGRIAHKEGGFFDALAEVGSLMCWLMGQCLETESIDVHVANTGNRKYDVVNLPVSLFRIPLACEVTPYNPLPQNALVMAELLREWMPTFQQLPDTDWRAFAEFFLTMLKAPRHLLKPEAQVKAEQAAAAQAAAQQTAATSPPPGAAPMPAPTEGPAGGLDPAMLAALGGMGGAAGGVPGPVPPMPAQPPTMPVA